MQFLIQIIFHLQVFRNSEDLNRDKSSIWKRNFGYRVMQSNDAELMLALVESSKSINGSSWSRSQSRYKSNSINRNTKYWYYYWRTKNWQSKMRNSQRTNLSYWSNFLHWLRYFREKTKNKSMQICMRCFLSYQFFGVVNILLKLTMTTLSMFTIANSRWSSTEGTVFSWNPKFSPLANI